MFGDSIRLRHVWTPQWHRSVILVKQMVIALIIVGTCIKPQHKLSNLCGHKKDEELKDIYKDRKITMVFSTQQSSEKLFISRVIYFCQGTSRNCNNMFMHWAHMIVQLTNLFLTTQSLISLGLI